jgi:hypothetical protein
VIAAVGNYVSLGKGRTILRRLQYVEDITTLIKWVSLDIFLSIVIGWAILAIAVPVAGYMSSAGTFKSIWVALAGGRFRAVYEHVIWIIMWVVLPLPVAGTPISCG